MKTTKFLMALAIAVSGTISIAQSGKVNLRADITATNENQDMQISVIDLETKDVLNREEVSSRFFYALPLSGRFMLHFKKEGHPAARLVIDTHVEIDQIYNLHFALNLKDLEASMETGISLSAGTISYDQNSGGFMLKTPESGKANLLAITYSGVGAGVGKF